MRGAPTASTRSPEVLRMSCHRYQETRERAAIHRTRHAPRLRRLPRGIALLGVLLVAGVASPVQSAANADVSRRPITIEDLWSVKRVGAPAVSPDGRWVAFTVTSYSMENNKGQGD